MALSAVVPVQRRESRLELINQRGERFIGVAGKLGVSLGRSETADMIVRHPLVSPLHVRFEPVGEGWIIVPLGLNGVFLRSAGRCSEVSAAESLPTDDCCLAVGDADWCVPELQFSVVTS